MDHPKLTGEMKIQNAITEVAAMVGENVRFRRGFTLSASSQGIISSYLHTSPQPGLFYSVNEIFSDFRVKTEIRLSKVSIHLKGPRTQGLGQKF